jgi:type II secretory pathway component GspD/PulD (secretin)
MTTLKDLSAKENTAMQAAKKLLMCLALALAICSLPGDMTAQPAAAPPPDAGRPSAGSPPPVEIAGQNGDVMLRLNFQDAPLQTVLEYLSETAGLTIVSDQPIVDGRMTVISRQPIALGEAITLINSVLKEKSLTAILTGRVLKLVTLDQAKQESVPVFSGRDPDEVTPSDDIVTYVIPVRYVTARALRENLEGLIPEYASLEANEDGNALIVTDTMANIQRLMKIVMALDTHMATASEIRVFRLTNAEAASAANMINTMFQQNQSSSRSRGGSRDGGNFFDMMRQRFGGGGPPGFGGRGGRGR